MIARYGHKPVFQYKFRPFSTDVPPQDGGFSVILYENGILSFSTYDANGDITGMTHVDVDTSDTMRTDVYTRTSTTITEVRTLASGEVLTITTDLTTQKTTYIFS